MVADVLTEHQALVDATLTGVATPRSPRPPAGTLAGPVAHPPEKIEHARLLKARGGSLAVIATKTGIPKTSLHRYLAGAAPAPAVDG